MAVKTSTAKGGGNKLLLVTGLTLGLISAALAFVYLRSAGEETGGGAPSGTTPVVVAAQDVAAGTRLTADMLTVQDISSPAVLTGAYSDPAELVGQVTVVPVVAGEQVITAKVAAGGDVTALGDDPPLSLILPEGQRAVAAPIANVDAVSGLVRPGDYVDVILGLKFNVRAQDDADENVGSDSAATTILQNVKVLSIEQDVTTTAVGTGEDAVGGTSPANEGTQPGAGTATFLVSPIHAEVLGLAALCAETYNGRMLVSLRGFGDGGPVPERTIWAEDGPQPTCASLFGLDALP
jgi:pilus assembly protein CpaB